MIPSEHPGTHQCGYLALAALGASLHVGINSRPDL